MLLKLTNSKPNSRDVKNTSYRAWGARILKRRPRESSGWTENMRAFGPGRKKVHDPKVGLNLFSSRDSAHLSATVNGTRPLRPRSSSINALTDVPSYRKEQSSTQSK